MSLPANTHNTYASVGNREDLSDIIYNVDPTETPFLSSVTKTKAKAVNHEWQTQALAAASSANAVLEGNDAVTDAVTATVRLGNIAQISDKVARVTGTQQGVAHFAHLGGLLGAFVMLQWRRGKPPFRGRRR